MAGRRINMKIPEDVIKRLEDAGFRGSVCRGQSMQPTMCLSSKKSTKPDFLRGNLVKEDRPLSFLTVPVDSYSAN